MRQTFTGSGTNLERVEILEYGKEDVEINYSTVQGDNLHNAFVPSLPTRPTACRSATLVLVHVERTKSFQWKISREAFDSVFDQCGLDPYVLYPMTRGVDGFYCLGESISESTGSSILQKRQTFVSGDSLPHDSKNSGQAVPQVPGLRSGWTCPRYETELNDTPRSYLICIRGSYMLAWTFFPKTRSTRAILISFPQNFIYTALKTEMERQKSLVGHPLFLAFVESIYLTGLVHTNIHNGERSIFLVEDQTNYSPWTDNSSSRFIKADQPVDDNGNLASLTRQVSKVVVHLSLHSRRLSIAKHLLNALLEYEPTQDSCTSSEGSLDLQSMRKAASLLDLTIETNQVYIEFLRERSKTQLTVLFNLITQRDATANIELAKDSRTIALASQHDSDSMKTIAIMTMVFLPGTFFATFFSSPWFQWNSSPVIQSQFWTFWAFTIPVTALVFALWFGITKRQTIRRQVENRRQRAKVKQRMRSFVTRGSAPDGNDSEHEEPLDGNGDGDDRLSGWRGDWVRRVLRKKRSRSRKDSGLGVELDSTVVQA
ncbi:hypothetical protein EV356DRAFT_579711 [Viridothelium virens]|uniref:Cora-domain-containing protein n=1 Tax=Viridothelium virens TaxID=1048519 RepID=A0A6A6GYF1_VIRVR|nr:hypothetical protein EV356DRAFT_579711 [Viridothelium virens]